MKGKLIILAGLPASGKDVLMNKLLELHSDLKKIVTYTDRPIRRNEVHKLDYHFVSTDKFEKLIVRDFFLEYVKTGPFFKGTSKTSFKPVLQGKNIIWRIDMFRASTIEETFQEKLGPSKADEILSRTVKILIQTDSYEEALSRFQKRNPDSKVEEFHSRYFEEIKIYEKNKERFPIVLTNKKGEFTKTLNDLSKLV